MKTYYINITKETITVDGETCNFYEAGLTNNCDPVEILKDMDEIKDVIVEWAMASGEDTPKIIFEDTHYSTEK